MSRALSMRQLMHANGSAHHIHPKGDGAVKKDERGEEDRHDEGLWLSRFDAWANSSAHVADPVFNLDGGAAGEVVHTEIVIYENDKERSAAERRAGLAALLLFPIGLGWRRRKL